MLHTSIAPAKCQPLIYTRTGSSPPTPEALIREHMKLVRRIAWHVHGSMSSAIEVEDLIQTGLVALIEAATGFEDRGQVTFVQYLNTRVRGAMIDALRRHATQTRGAMRRRRAFLEAEREIASEMGRAATEEEIAARLGVDLDRLHSHYAGGAQPVRFEPLDTVYNDESAWFASDEDDAFQQLEKDQLREVLIAAIGTLAEREALVVQLYYVEELNLEEIGQVLGVGAGAQPNRPQLSRAPEIGGRG